MNWICYRVNCEKKLSNSKSKVFAETYQKYMVQIRSIDFLEKADGLGLTRDGDGLIIPLYNNIYKLNSEGIEALDGGQLNTAIRIILCKYVITWSASSKTVNDELVSFREFKNAAPLISYFANNTNKTLQLHFSGNLEKLKTKALSLGGELLQSETYDLSFCFQVLPRIPVFLNFNDQDDMFAATCSILYKKSASLYLDMECLAMTGTLLSGRLLDSH